VCSRHGTWPYIAGSCQPSVAIQNSVLYTWYMALHSCLPSVAIQNSVLQTWYMTLHSCLPPVAIHIAQNQGCWLVDLILRFESRPVNFSDLWLDSGLNPHSAWLDSGLDPRSSGLHSGLNPHSLLLDSGLDSCSSWLHSGLGRVMVESMSCHTHTKVQQWASHSPALI